MLAGLFLQEQKPPAVYTGTMLAGELVAIGTVTGYDPVIPIGSISNPNFEGRTITNLHFTSLVNTNYLFFNSGLDAHLTKIRINGIEYNLSVFGEPGTYRFSDGESRFVNGISYNIEFIR